MILRAILFWKMACFCPFLHYIAHSSTRDFKLWRARTALWKVKSDWKSMEIVNWLYQESKSCENFEFLPFIRAARVHNARADTYGRKILEML